MAALLAHERLLPSMFGCFVDTQLGPGQEGFRTLGTLQMKCCFKSGNNKMNSRQMCVMVNRGTHSVWFGVTVDLHHVNRQVFLVHELFRTQ